VSFAKDVSQSRSNATHQMKLLQLSENNYTQGSLHLSATGSHQHSI